MCGIVAAVAHRNVVPILIEGLRRLEYRGYDSAGVAVINGELRRVRSRCSCPLITPPSSGGATSTSRETWLSPLRSSNQAARFAVVRSGLKR